MKGRRSRAALSSAVAARTDPPLSAPPRHFAAHVFNVQPEDFQVACPIGERRVLRVLCLCSCFEHWVVKGPIRSQVVPVAGLEPARRFNVPGF
ncbi:MAG: hypothetical protein RL514_3267 [Verrucomicrobiota bacterium]